MNKLNNARAAALVAKFKALTGDTVLADEWKILERAIARELGDAVKHALISVSAV